MRIRSVCQCVPGWSLMSSRRVAQVKGWPLTKFILFSPSKGWQSLKTCIRTRQVRRYQQDGTTLCKFKTSIQHLSHRQECDEGVKLKEICQHRLAAAGCLHTAVALELSAGQTRAAVLTRKPARLTTPLTRRHLHPDRPPRGRPDRRRLAGQRAPA